MNEIFLQYEISLDRDDTIVFQVLLSFFNRLQCNKH